MATTETPIAPAATPKKPPATHIFYLLQFPSNSPEDYRFGVTGVPSADTKYAIKLRRGVHRLPIEDWEPVENNPLTAEWIEKGYLKVVAKGDNFVRDCLNVPGTNTRISVPLLIERVYVKEYLEEALEWLRDQELSKNSVMLDWRKKIEERIEAMEDPDKGIALPLYGQEHPEKARNQGSMEMI
jgi:hypothetical protein